MLITYNNKAYAINLNKIMNFYSNTDQNKVKETEIIDMYEMDENNIPKLISKQTREIKSNQASQDESFKYDLIKMFLTILLDNNTEIKDDEITADLGTLLAFNTFLENGFIYEINE